MLPQGEASELASLRRHGAADGMVDEHILRVIRSAETSATPYTDATQVSWRPARMVTCGRISLHSTHINMFISLMRSWHLNACLSNIHTYVVFLHSFS